VFATRLCDRCSGARALGRAVSEEASCIERDRLHVFRDDLGSSAADDAGDRPHVATPDSAPEDISQGLSVSDSLAAPHTSAFSSAAKIMISYGVLGTLDHGKTVHRGRAAGPDGWGGRSWPGSCAKHTLNPKMVPEVEAETLNCFMGRALRGLEKKKKMTSRRALF